MVRKKAENKIILDETKGTTKKRTYKKVVEEAQPVVEEPVKIEPAKAEPVVAKTAKPKVTVHFVNVDNLSIEKMKVFLLQVASKMGVTIKSKDVNAFALLRMVGKMVGLEPWEAGKGAEHTKQYLKRIWEKVNNGK